MMKVIEFNKSISHAEFSLASIDHNSTANIVHLTIRDSSGNIDYKIALEWEQMDDLITLCHQIAVKQP